MLSAASTGALLHPDVNAQTSTGQSAPAANTHQFLQQAYDLQYLSGANGGSDTIGIVDAGGDSTAASDLATFRSQFGLPACTVASGCLQQVNQSGSATSLPGAISGWGTEESLDLDAVSALCPNCHIILVEASSTSFSNLETAAQTAVNLGAEQVSESFGGVLSGGGLSESGWTYPGVQVFAATGDSGYPGAGNNQVPAAFPDVNAVAGTTLTALGASGSTAYSDRGFAESAWSLSGNEGGGSGCDTYETKPPFQNDTGCSGRSYGDMSADANPDTGLDVYASSDGGWELVGGTSLATPLLAAYAAVTGVAATSTNASWAYANSSLLNDPVSGSSGSCAANIAYICTAGVGYDGPTGIGSIEGDLTSGAPGIGGTWNGTTSASPTDAVSTQAGSVTLQAGIYPNGLATSFSWQFGTSTSYGQSTPTESLTASNLPQAVQDTVALSPASTYHFRLVAQNADGTTYGYDQTIQTSAGTPPVNSGGASISGTAAEGQTLSAIPGTWSGAATLSYQWQSYTPAGGWQNITSATTPSYVVQAGDVGDPIHVIVTGNATDSSTSSVQSAPTAAVSANPAPVNSSAPQITGTATDGQTLSVSTGTWSPSGTVTYLWQRNSANGWTTIPNTSTNSYQLTPTDVGAQIDAVVTETNATGSTSVTAGAVGPISGDPPVNTEGPTISGAPTEGNTLSVSTGTWSPSGTVSYAWERDAGAGWSVIADANSSNYLLGAEDVGDSVEAVVTETDSDGLSSVIVSAGPITAAPPAPPTTTTPTATTPSTTTSTPTDSPTYTTPSSTQTTPSSSPSTPAQAPTTATTPASSTQTSSTPASNPGQSQTPSGPEILTAPRLSAPATLTAGSRITLSAGTSTGGTASVRLYVCNLTCVAAAPAQSTQLTVLPAQAGDYFTAKLTVTGEGSSVSAWAPAAIGPVRAANVAVSAPPANFGVLRDGAGQKLATAAAHRSGSKLTLTLKRASGAPSSTARVCAISPGTAPVCGTAVRLTGAARTLKLSPAAGATVRLIAVAPSPA